MSYGFKTVSNDGTLQLDEAHPVLPVIAEGMTTGGGSAVQDSIEIDTGVVGDRFFAVPFMFIRPLDWLPAPYSGTIGMFEISEMDSSHVTINWAIQNGSFEYKICAMEALPSLAGETGFGMRILGENKPHPGGFEGQKEVFDSRRLYPRIKQLQRYYYPQGWYMHTELDGTKVYHDYFTELTDWDYIHRAYQGEFGPNPADYLDDNMYAPNTYYYPNVPWILFNGFGFSERAITPPYPMISNIQWSMRFRQGFDANAPLQIEAHSPLGIGDSTPGHGPAETPLVVLVAEF